MPSKKKGRGGRAQVPELSRAEELETGLSLVRVGASKATSSSAPAPCSASAKLIEGIGKSSPGRPISGGLCREAVSSSTAVACSQLTGGGAASSSSVLAAALLSDGRNSPKSASSGAAEEPATAQDEPSADEFQDALEELVQSSDHPVEEEDPLGKLLAKDPSLQMPALSRSAWDTEMEALRKLVEDAEVEAAEKVRVLHEAFTQRVEDLRKLEEHHTALERQLTESQKERDRCKKETAAAMAGKAKLEDTCRELQQLKVNITSESKKIVEEERERQTELNRKFEAAMKDVNDKMVAETEVRDHFIRENGELRTKLGKFFETYEEQERQLAEQNSARETEMKAARDRLKEYEQKAQDSAANAAILEKKNKAIQKSTVALRAELQAILSRFDEFHEAVNESNQKHAECKEDIDVLSDKLKELDAENASLKSNERINAVTKEKEAVQKQRDLLEKLIANLQKDNEAARQRLRAAGKL